MIDEYEIETEVSATEAAFHEAGHAVVALCMSKRVSEVLIRPGDAGWTGDTTFDIPNAEIAECAEMAIDFAGYIATILNRRAIEARDIPGAGKDIRNAHERGCRCPRKAWDFAFNALEQNWGFACYLVAELCKDISTLRDDEKAAQDGRANVSEIGIEYWRVGPRVNTVREHELLDMWDAWTTLRSSPNYLAPTPGELRREVLDEAREQLLGPFEAVP